MIRAAFYATPGLSITALQIFFLSIHHAVPEGTLGFCKTWGTWVVPRSIGWKEANEMLLDNGERLKAAHLAASVSTDECWR
jgi:hypothetical protein